MKKSEITVPVRVRDAGYSYWLESKSQYGYQDACSATWLSLAAYTDDPDNYITSTERDVRDIGIYVWFDESSVNLDIRFRDICSMTIFECESRLKLIKKLSAKASKTFPLSSFVKNTTVHTQLTKLLDALGIKRALDYTGKSLSGDPFPIGIALKYIGETLDKCREGLEKKAL